MKKNDFIVASINNPTFGVADFKDIGNMDLSNTLMLSEEDYLKSKFIRENKLFQDSNGNFVKEKFSDFYRKKLRDFSEFSTESALDNYQYGLFDTFRKGNSKIRPFGVTFTEVANSERKSMGVVGPNLGGERTLSDRELAQREKIFDYNKGEFRDYTPNDLALTKNPFKWIGSFFDDPLVLATYDSNGTHYDPILGREVEHVKGQKKLNANGVPYYETLAGRSAANKDLLSFTDNLTIDGSWLNKYDFFDTDDMDKSVVGTVMKNVAVLAPMFIPGAGQYYAGALVTREIAKTMPMLYGMAGLFDADLPESKIMNTIGAIGQKFTGNTSDYAKEKMFSFENFGNLVSDVALQWGQQQWVINNLSKINKATKATEEAAKAKALSEYTAQASKLMTQGEKGEMAMSRVTELTGAANREQLEALLKSDNWMGTIFGGAALEKYMTPARDIIARKTKLAQDLSLGYMAIISNTDVYQDALDHGASKREAAMLALGSTVGMFSVDKYLGLGEIFYDPAQKAERQIFRNTVLDEANKITKQLESLTPEVTVKVGEKVVKDEKKGLGRLFLKGIQAGKRAVNEYQGAIKEGTLGFFGKAAGEGLEEVSEELVTDIVKQLGEIAGDFGAGPTDLGAWLNMKDRYLMSLLGGAIGGGIFALKDGNFKARQASGELLLLLRQGKGQEIRDELARLHKDGQLGSTELSYKTQDTVDENGNVQSVFLTADKDNQSQNDYAYNTLTLAIEQIETIILKNHLKKTESELFEDLVLQDENFMALKDYLEDKSYITGYLRRYQQLTKNIVAQELKIAELSKTDGETRANQIELEKAKNDLNNMLLERDKFFNGDYSLEYLQKMLFAINPQLAGAFMPITKHQFTRQYFHTSYDLLDGGMQKFVDQLYEQTVKDPSKMEEELDKSFNKFKELQPNMEKILSKQAGGSKEWENIKSLLDKEGIMKPEDEYNYDSLLPGENEESESYVNRNTQMEGESPLQFAQRRRDRVMTIAEENARRKIRKLQAVLDLAKTFEYGPNGEAKPASFIDPSTKRYLLSYLGETKEHIKNRKIARLLGLGIDKSLLSNAENYGELVQKVRDTLKVRFEKEALELLQSQTGSALPQDELYEELGLGNKHNLKQVRESLENLGLEPNQENLSMYIESDDMNAFDLYMDMGRYNDLLAKMMAETDPDKLEELRKQLEELDNKEYDAYNQEFVDNYINAQVEETFSKLEPKLKDLNSDLNNDAELQLAKDIEDRLSIEDNPAVQLVKDLAPSIGGSAVEVERALESIFKQFKENERATDFTLSGDLEKYLEEAKQLIGIVRAMVAAASRPSNLQDGMTYNKAVNKFHADHKAKQGQSEFFNNFEPLFEMDEKIGGQLIVALDGYIDEINSWINLSRLNRANSTRSLQRAAEALNNARLSFLSRSMKSNEFLEDSIINENSPNALFHFEKQFHDNVQKAIADGRDLKDIIRSLIGHINQDTAILSGITSNIDEDLRELTAYDKFTYLISLIGIDPKKQLELERDFIKANPKIAPLATQQPAMQLGKALAADPKVINTALEVLQELAKANGLDIPVMYNTTVVTGLGGGGKTSVIVKYLLNADGEGAWIAGPTNKQIETLSALAPKATALSVEDLLKKILGNDLGTKVYKEDASIKEIKSGKGLDKQDTIFLKGIKDSDYIIKDAPKQFIIDEATHIGNLALQAIGNWARLAGVKVTIVGDENLRGKVTKTPRSSVANLARETLLTFRTPRLNFSLRNESIWKVQNNNKIVSLLDKARNASSETEEAIFNEILEALHNKIELSYFENDSTLEGEKIVSKLTAEDLHKLNGSVAYIGNNKERINFILGNLNPNATFEVFEKDEVQGREFDYVIVDSDWDGKLAKSTSKNRVYEELLFLTADLLRDLYTMISRSRRGSIILDNQITEVVKGIKEDYTTKYERLTPEVIEQFIQDRLSYIEGILSSLEPETVEIEEKKEEEEPKEEEEETQEEELPVENLPEKDKDEIVDIPPREQDLPKIGYRAYGNVQFKGNVTTGDRKQWIPAGGPIRDLGIFNPGNDGILAHNGDEKKRLVTDLNFIKSLFLYKHNIDLYDIPSSLRGIVTKEDLKAATFWLAAEDKSEVHDLIGETTLDDTKQDFMPGKVISIQARINTSKGPAIVTLGAVADPDTWRKLLDNPNMSSAEKTQLSAQITHYENLLKNLISSEELEIQINRPNFSGRTELIPLRLKDLKAYKEGKIEKSRGDERRKVRLENLDDGTSEWDLRTGHSVVSPIYVLTSEVPNISKDLVGHAVVFVSNDNTLAPEQLGRLYIQQQQFRNEGPAAVRMVVLDNAGVSFHSVYRKGLKDIYKTTRNDSDFIFPFQLLPLSIRMLSSMWNFRADLIRFKNAMDNSGFTRDQLIEMAKLDSQLYQELQAQLKEESEATNGEERRKNPVPTSKEYKTWLKSYSDQEKAGKVLKLIEFNEGLDIPRFRVGWSDRAGAYIRRIDGLTDTNKYYTKRFEDKYKPDEINGIFINPDLADQYLNMINDLFDNVIGRMFKMEGVDTDETINYKEAEKWLNNAKAKKLRVNGQDIALPDQKLAKAFPLIIFLIAEHMHYKMHYGAEDFNAKYTRTEDPYHHIYLDLDDKANTDLDYTHLDEHLVANIAGKEVRGLIKESASKAPIIGQYEYTYESGDVNYQDRRIDNFFNLMFHGVVMEKSYNDFESGQQAASDALFKYGFFVDPVLVSTGGKASDFIGLCATNRALFQTDVVPGNPILEFSFDRVGEGTETNVEEQEENPYEDTMKQLNSVGLDTSRWDLSMFENPEEIEGFIEDLVKLYINKFFNQQNTDVSKLIYSVEDGKVITIIDKYPELKAISKAELNENNNILTVTTTDNKIYKIVNNDGTITVDSGSAPGNRKTDNPETNNTSLYSADEIISKINDYTDGKDIYDDSDVLATWLEDNSGMLFSAQDLIEAKKYLSNELGNEGILEVSDVSPLLSIIDSFISETNNSDCVK